MIKKWIKGLLAALGFWGAGLVYAAPCCTGGTQIPSLIVNDDEAQLGLSLSAAKIVADAPLYGPTSDRGDGDNEQMQSFFLDGAWLLSDRWQMGANAALIRHTREIDGSAEASTGLGDLALTLGYEALPEFEYSAWIPRLFLFSQVVMPAGGSVYDSTLPYEVDARGRGFYVLAAGAVAVKTWLRWDLSLRAGLSKSLPRDADSAMGPYHISPGWGWNALLAGGYSFANFWRVGGALSGVYEGPVSFSGLPLDTSASQLVGTVEIDVGRSLGRFANLNLAYADQTLLGALAYNSTLSRTITLAFRYRWER